MTLSFSTQWDNRMGELAGQPTYFAEKIFNGLISKNILTTDDFVNKVNEFTRFYNPFTDESDKQKYLKVALSRIPKYHTIRRDLYNRWKSGMEIHFVINNRTKDRFQFAPVLKAKTIQKIEIENFGYYQDNLIFVDNRELNMEEMEQLARNDGFPNLKAFFQYFNEDFEGKLIHWTDFKY